MALQRGRGARLKGLRSGHVAELVAELDPLIRGRVVRDLAAFPPRDLMLVLEGEPVLRLRLSADGNAPRIHAQLGRTMRHKGPVGPFFQRLTEELVGAEVRSLEQVRGDRIVLLEFRGTPSGKRRALAIELVGRHANQVLLGPGDEVLDVLVPPPRKGANSPRLSPGSPWAPPGGKARAEDGEEPPLTSWLPDPSEPAPGSLDAPLSWRVESSLGNEATEARRAHLAKDLANRLKRRHGRAKGLVEGLKQRQEAADGAQRVQQDGELLKAAMGQIQRGQDSIEVSDWFEEGAPPRRITLDPRRSPQANVERLFDRARKLERARASVASELAMAQEKVALLEDLLTKARTPESDPVALEAEALAARVLEQRQQGDPRKRKAPAPRLPYRSYPVSGGFEVRVGRSAPDNDALTFKHARGNDLWLHTADCPGSHVILRLEKRQEVDPEALVDAALLAVHFSPAKGGDRIPVHVAHRKEVHKPKGAKAGLVTLSGGRILQVRAQQERLEGLLRRARGRSESPSEDSQDAT